MPAQQGSLTEQRSRTSSMLPLPPQTPTAAAEPAVLHTCGSCRTSIAAGATLHTYLAMPNVDHCASQAA